jgi:hypothetical protein
VQTKNLVSQSIWNSLGNEVTELLFEYSRDISAKLFSVGPVGVSLKEGRAILDSGNNRYSLMDHIGAQISGGGGWSYFSVGGSLGYSISFIRPIAAPADAANIPGLLDWNPNTVPPPAADPDAVAAYNEGMDPIYNAIGAELKAGNKDLGKQMFQQDAPIQKYLDLLAGLKLPGRMPWSAKDLLNPKKFQTGDIASYVATGGIWASFGALSSGVVEVGASIGAFLNGSYRVTIMKESDTEVLFQIQAGDDYGLDYEGLELRFQIPIVSGISIINGKKITFTPLTITGHSYKSTVFSRAYRLDLSSDQARKGLDAALLGNLIPLDSSVGNDSSDILLVSNQMLNGTYDDLTIDINLGLLDYDRTTNDAVENLTFHDSRGSFARTQATSSRVVNADATLFKLEKQTIQQAQSTLFTQSPEGPIPPQFSWVLEDVDFFPTKKGQQSFLDQAALAIGASPWNTAYYERQPKGLQHLALEFDFTSGIFGALTSLSEREIWAEFEHLSNVTPGSWATQQKRDGWRDSDGGNTLIVPTLGGYTYTGNEVMDIYDDFYDSFVKMKKQAPQDQVKALIDLNTEYTDYPVLPRVLVDLGGPSNAFIHFENDGADLLAPYLLDVNPEADQVIDYPSPYDWINTPPYSAY